MPDKAAISSTPLSGRIGSAPDAFTLTPQKAFLALAVYLLLQIVLRIFVSSSAELDESEQLLVTQTWAWGYGSDPPLYTWLQIASFQVFGTSILGLAVLKNLLLFSGFALTFFAARSVGANQQLSAIAMLALLLFPQVAWESQRDLTHSVLATALAAASFLLAVQIIRTGRPRAFVALGVCFGLGLLSKYSYGLFALTLAAAILTLPTVRKKFLSPWMLVALVLSVLITGCHFHWVLLKPAQALSRPDEILRASGGWHLAGWGRGFLSLIKCAFMLVGCLGLGFLLVFRGQGQVKPTKAVEPFVQLIERTLLIVLAVSLLVILGLAIELKDRWFQPAVFLGGILAALLVKDRVTSCSAKRFFCLAMTVMSAALVVLPGIPLAAALTQRPTRLNAPYDALCHELKGRIAQPSVIVAESRLVGGNLRLWFERSVVIAPEFHALPVSSDVAWLVVWDASKQQAPPAPLVNLVAALRRVDVANLPPSFVEAPYQYIKTRQMRLGYVVVPGRQPSQSSSTNP